ncbi:hypothetical protein [Actibacterium lipolyticum]|uniref:Uncharacterized protein n=1 Tax=Actibacterium lipolyticum TaxID=1524263 RepID=A0A238KLD7_9RHOB|nr:hypothetical protein [Actibacterium lipolyticum]SMX43574.1 hypothetical protein COL8621_02335 [Actibacterium lipolyticum]
MSDLVRNMEIEDVLSSIRRLVSDEASQRQGRPTGSRPQENLESEEDERTERLVLTPALRVAKEEAETEDDSDESEVLFSDEPPVFSRSHSFYSDSSEPSVSFSTTNAHESAADPTATRGPRTVTLEDRIAELEAAVALADEEWEPDGDEEALGTMVLENPLPQADMAPANDAGATTDETSFDAVEEAAEEPEDEILNAVAPEVMDDVAVVASAAVSAVSEETENAFSKGFDLSDDLPANIDEEILRDLISEIVREELQGALGERITRNVRKLVRREINRAMASRDFD